MTYQSCVLQYTVHHANSPTKSSHQRRQDPSKGCSDSPHPHYSPDNSLNTLAPATSLCSLPVVRIHLECLYMLYHPSQSSLVCYSSIVLTHLSLKLQQLPMATCANCDKRNGIVIGEVRKWTPLLVVKLGLSGGQELLQCPTLLEPWFTLEI